ncbi:MAG: AEC family transporter [Candidatus Caldatribacteriaceae bacterium]
MYQVLIAMFLMIALGFFLRLGRVLPREATFLLNKLALYVTFPCLVFRSLQNSQLDPRLWDIPLLAYPIISVLFLLSYSLAHRGLKLSVPTSVSFAMGSAFGNTAFLGYPFIMAIVGEKGLPPAIFFDQMGNFLSVYTVGILFCTYGKSKKISFQSAGEIFKLPPFLSFLLALAFHRLSLPPFLQESINRLADATVPLTMLSLGLSLSGAHLFQNVRPLLVASILKLAALPLGMLFFTRLYPLPPLYRQVMILESATPTLMTSYVLASLYHLDEQFSASVIFITTLIALLTLPIWGLFFHP